VTTLPAVWDTGTDLTVDGFAVGYVAEDGTPRWVPLTFAQAPVDGRSLG
jgi:hypothetical protein